MRHRCHRLKRECEPSKSIRKRALKSRSKAEDLEKKLGKLESLLKKQTNAAQPQPQPQEHAPWAPKNPTTYIHNIIRANLDHMAPEDNTVSDSLCTAGIPATPPSSTVTTITSKPWPPGEGFLYDIPNGAMEERLRTFRQFFLPLFPFIYIPLTTDARELRDQKPFLWLVIMSLTTKSATQQLEMGETIRRIVSQKIVNGERKSLDTLQGMICYIAWLVGIQRAGTFTYHISKAPLL